MAKMMKSKGRMVSGKKYAEEDEKYDRKKEIKEQRAMKTAGISTALKKSEKEEGYSKKPKVKPQKKKGKLDLKRGQVY